MSDTARNTIEESINSQRIFLFMKGKPSQPSCGFSALVVQILNLVGQPYGAFDVLGDDSVREGIKQYSEWPTIPQLYVDGEFIGGCDIVREMYESGELQPLLNNEQSA